MHIFHHIFLSNYWWQKSDIWSQASYRYTILWDMFLDPSDSYFLFADLVVFYTHWTYMHIFHHIFTATIDGRNLIFGHKLHIGTSYRGKRFWTHRIPTSCLPTLLIFIHIHHTFVYAHFSSHFSQQLLMTGIWYLVTSFILVCHIVGNVFGPIRFLLPVCRLSWFLYTLNIYAHFSSHFSQQPLMAEIWYLVTSFI
jgi:hypothetical protein